MLWTSAGGVPVGCAVMNTAVPCTRTGCVASTVATNSLSGSARAAKRSATSRRPVLHVVMNVKRIVATASVTHPPCSSFKAFAPKNARSIVRKRSMTASAACLGQRQRSIITMYNSNTVMTIVSVTAIPYADATAPDDPKPITMSTVAIMGASTRSLQPLNLISGIRRDAIVRLLVGEQDVVTPADLSLRYADALQKRGVDAQVTILPGLGHNIKFTPPVFAEIT